MFNLVADHIIKGRIYPAAARWQARPYTEAWRQFGHHWPWTEPLRLQEYCEQHNYPLQIFKYDKPVPEHSWYPIGLGFFDFSIDYIALLPPLVRERVRSKEFGLLFLYHEGDNPYRIQQRLYALCQQHDMPRHCYRFVSSNSQADTIEDFVCFVDFELWYWQRNREHHACEIHSRPRPFDFLALSRLHKPWRALIMADLEQLGILDRSIWSYCQKGNMLDQIDNPIEIDYVAGCREHTENFLTRMPKFADDLSDQQRNDHSGLVADFYQQSYCNIVLETHFDVDQSGGCFLTEKTFKAIKHGQIFFIAGAAGSLAQLRRLGYRTFDHVLDNTYDTVADATQRWQALRHSIQKAMQQGMHEIYLRCLDDVHHNQQLFCSSKTSRLNTLWQRLNSYDH